MPLRIPPFVLPGAAGTLAFRDALDATRRLAVFSRPVPAATRQRARSTVAPVWLPSPGPGWKAATAKGGSNVTVWFADADARLDYVPNQDQHLTVLMGELLLRDTATSDRWLLERRQTPFALAADARYSLLPCVSCLLSLAPAIS